ncbi:MAG: ABC transporter permease [Chloroflexota bacterium]|nr:ABC transporter permease [Chloroflexota bacterium]
MSLTEFKFSTRWQLIWSVVWMRLRIISRYPGGSFFEIILPTFIAAMPILLGQAVGGGAAQAAANFQQNTGTANYVAYLLIGANVFMLVSGTMWNMGYWMRREQETGTLEALYLAPTGRGSILLGISLYGMIRMLFNFVAAFALGSLIFRVNPLQGDILLALVFLIVGLVPLFGISLLYGAIILRVKAANALIQLAQWLVSFLMGLFFPIAVFPMWLRVVALLFPPTWMNNGVRASLLGVGFFFEHWYFDLAVLGIFCVIAPWLGYGLFTRTERGVKRDAGVGEF